MSKVFDARVGHSRPSNYYSNASSAHDNGATGWFIAQGLNEVAKAIVEAATILAKKELR